MRYLPLYQTNPVSGLMRARHIAFKIPLNNLFKAFCSVPATLLMPILEPRVYFLTSTWDCLGIWRGCGRCPFLTREMLRRHGSNNTTPFTFPCSPNQVAEKVASRIAEGFNDTALIMVDNTKFTMECVEPAIHVYELHENKWRCKDPHVDFCEDWNEAQRIAASLLDSKSYETLVDFDNHLDDIRNDWTNPEINKAVLHLC
uniref:ER membrane protein complex subunit 8 n=1 Tax=Cairina moschata TaxID=8855 RepID=A0A8C3C595_CAIMO